jgi:hypothetical protein
MQSETKYFCLEVRSFANAQDDKREIAQDEKREAVQDGKREVMQDGEREIAQDEKREVVLGNLKLPGDMSGNLEPKLEK